MRFFIPKDKNVEKFGIFEGNSPNLEVIYPTQPNPTQLQQWKNITPSDLGQKKLAKTQN